MGSHQYDRSQAAWYWYGGWLASPRRPASARGNATAPGRDHLGWGEGRGEAAVSRGNGNLALFFSESPTRGKGWAPARQPINIRRPSRLKAEAGRDDGTAALVCISKPSSLVKTHCPITWLLPRESQDSTSPIRLGFPILNSPDGKVPAARVSKYVPLQGLGLKPEAKTLLFRPHKTYPPDRSASTYLSVPGQVLSDGIRTVYVREN